MPKPKLTAEQIHELWDVNVEEGTIKHRFNSNRAKIGDDATSLTTGGYLRIRKNINKKHYQWCAHHIIWIAAGNNWPTQYEEIHHKDEDRANNKIDNLICLSISDHVFHHTDTPEDLRYICWNSASQKWVIQIHINHQRKHFGYYKDIEDAKTARDEILKLLASEQGNNDG